MIPDTMRISVLLAPGEGLLDFGPSPADPPPSAARACSLKSAACYSALAFHRAPTRRNETSHPLGIWLDPTLKLKELAIAR
jgi:hypothetical protein